MEEPFLKKTNKNVNIVEAFQNVSNFDTTFQKSTNKNNVVPKDRPGSIRTPQKGNSRVALDT